VALSAAAAARADATCTSADLRLDRDLGPMVAFAPQPAPNPGDAERAQSRLRGIRRMIEPFRDLRHVLAEADSDSALAFARFERAPTGTLISIDRPHSHDNEHEPRMLLYRRKPDGFALVGVQFQALNERSDAELDDILPLSIARWHQAVRHCSLPPGRVWIATVFPFAKTAAATWRTLEFDRYVPIRPYRYRNRTKKNLRASAKSPPSPCRT
jgi:hypothetical protein